MIPRTLGQIAQVTGGALSAPGAAGVLVDGPVVTDSRQAGAGSLYVARIGEHADGHRYAAAAAAAGAVGALVTKPVSELPYVLVADVQEAFAALAESLITDSPELIVIGVTGSSGKTTTKDLLAQLLAGLGPTVANAGSLNSEVGVPLTVCRLQPDTRHLILEMGARGIGHVRYLARMTHPRVGAVLNVGSAHLGEFGSREAIGRAKAELAEALPAGGLAVLNADDDLVSHMTPAAGADILRFGRGPGADVQARNVILDEQGYPGFDLSYRDESINVKLRLMGEHQVANSLAAAAVALWLGMPLAGVAHRLARATPASRYRMERHERPDGVTIINDAYNANPESMRSALRTLGVMRAPGGGKRRTIAVLGEMLELGPDSVAQHRLAGTLARASGIDVVVAVGDSEAAGAIAGGAAGGPEPAVPGDAAAGGPAPVSLTGPAAPEVYRAASVDDAGTLLSDLLQEGDLVLVKSSHGAGLRLLGERLAEGGQHR